MGNNQAWFLLLFSLFWTIIIFICSVTYLDKEGLPLTLSYVDVNFDSALINLVKLHVKFADSNAEGLRSVKVYLKDKVVLINDKNTNRRLEKFYSILRIRDEEKLEELYDYEESSIAVLVLVCDRVTVRRCLDRLLLYRPSSVRFPVIVSQDCSDIKTEITIREFGNRVYFVKQPRMNIHIPKKELKLKGYYHIASHYAQALNLTFLKYNFNYVIIVEDDLEISPDFFEYFSGTLPILKADPTLWCISAWNDHGKKDLINHGLSEKLYRTDFFPGLGWMLSKSIWLELSNKWPTSYWDDWMRLPEQRKNRSCIRPEISRTKSFVTHGVSSFMFYKKHLHDMYLNTNFVKFTNLNLSYLMKEKYDEEFLMNVYRSPVIRNITYKFNRESRPIRILYDSDKSFKEIAKRFNLLNDLKSGVPRAAYKGVVTFFHHQRIYLAPSFNWTEYNTTWK